MANIKTFLFKYPDIRIKDIEYRGALKPNKKFVDIGEGGRIHPMYFKWCPVLLYFCCKNHLFLYDLCKYANLSYHAKGNYELALVNLIGNLVLVKVNDTSKAYDG